MAHAAPEPAGRGRRAVIAAGATAAAGALGVVLARPADAAAGSALLLGRSNSSGSAGTTVSSSTSGSAFYLKASAGNGLLSDAVTNTHWAVYARATSKSAGPAGAVLAKGGRNIGLMATTAAPRTAARPALFADGGSGGWGSLVLGDEVVNGAVFADFALTGVFDPTQTSNGNIGYADVVSAPVGMHVATGKVAILAADPTATVALTTAFRNAVDLTRATVQLTPLGASMPNLYATIDAANGTLTAHGGVPDFFVSWTVSAPRVNLDGSVAPASASTAPTTLARVKALRPRA